MRHNELMGPTRHPGRTRLTGVIAIALLTTVAGANDWNQFRGPSGDGRTASERLPCEWSETIRVRWKTPIPGKAWASPVVAGPRIWLANATEDGRPLSTT